MLTLTSATRAESPEDVDGAVAEGAVAVRALAPERGFVTGGLRVAVHGAGFTDALACQFGPRVVAPVSINEQGTEMLCVAPPFANHAGGFVRVGVAVAAAAAPGAAASPPRGALTFAYEVTPRPTSVAPRSIDASGGEVVWITGGDLHVADACAFEPRPARIVAKRFVSSALGACETPARTPGEGAVALVASDENLYWRGHGVLNDVWNDGGVAGLAVVAYRSEDKEILRDGAETASAALAARRTAEFRERRPFPRTRRLPRTHPFRWRYLLFRGKALLWEARRYSSQARIWRLRPRFACSASASRRRRRRREKEKKRLLRGDPRSRYRAPSCPPR